jgi:hypothetical protein
MATLEGQTIAGSYKDLLQVSNSNSGVDATARAVSDGEGTATLLYVSTTEVYSPGKAGTSNTVFGKSAGASLDAGSNYNVFIGENVSDATMADALNNVGVGYAALSALTSGENNVAIGYQSALALADGDLNVAVGVSALASNVSCNAAVAIGREALRDLTHADAIGTIGIGQGAGAALTTGAGNTVIGYQAADAMTVGTSNTALGYQALSAEVEGTRNTAIGYAALTAQNAGGSDGGASNTSNTAVGYNAGLGTTTGINNTYIGTYSANAMTTALNNVAIGKSAFGGAADQAVNYCVAIGVSALSSASITTGADGSIAIGTNALASLTSGASNTAVGYQAGDALTTGYENTVLGKNALGADVGGGRNVAIGFNALETQTGVTGHQFNTSVGAYSGRYVSTGTENTFIGYYAGYGASGTPTTGSYNTVVGSSAGGALEGAGADNTLIGRAAGSTITTGTSNIIIGSSVAPSSVTGTNQIAIGGTGQGNNTVTLGNDDITDVYMASDGAATVRCGNVHFNSQASGDVNTLDDYEEGTWTPTLTNMTIGNGTVDATYTKIGRQIFVRCSVTLGSTSSVDGAWTFYNLPLTIPNNELPAYGMFMDNGANQYPAYGYCISHRVYMRETNGNAAVDATTPWTWADGDEIQWMLIYED